MPSAKRQREEHHFEVEKELREPELLPMIPHAPPTPVRGDAIGFLRKL